MPGAYTYTCNIDPKQRMEVDHLVFGMAMKAITASQNTIEHVHTPGNTMQMI